MPDRILAIVVGALALQRAPVRMSRQLRSQFLDLRLPAVVAGAALEFWCRFGRLPALAIVAYKLGSPP